MVCDAGANGALSISSGIIGSDPYYTTKRDCREQSLPGNWSAIHQPGIRIGPVPGDLAAR
jgi:hypothetical protein